MRRDYSARKLLASIYGVVILIFARLLQFSVPPFLSAPARFSSASQHPAEASERFPLIAGPEL